MNFLILDNFRIIKKAVSFQSISSLTGSIVLHDFQYSSEVFVCRENHSGTNATSLLQSLDYQNVHRCLLFNNNNAR